MNYKFTEVIILYWMVIYISILWLLLELLQLNNICSEKFHCRVLFFRTDAVLSEVMQTSPGDAYLNRVCSAIDLDTLSEEPVKKCTLCGSGQSWELIWILIDNVGSLLWSLLFLIDVVRIMDSDLYLMVCSGFLIFYLSLFLYISKLLRWPIAIGNCSLSSIAR